MAPDRFHSRPANGSEQILFPPIQTRPVQLSSRIFLQARKLAYGLPKTLGRRQLPTASLTPNNGQVQTGMRNLAG